MSLPLNFHQTPNAAWPRANAPLYRAAAPRYWQDASGLPIIAHVLDLQTPEEARRDTDSGWRWPASCTRHAVAIREPGGKAAKGWGARYQALIDANRAAFQTAARLIAQAPEGAATLVHCSHGKDRTGLLVAALMEKAGADRADILAHFAACVSALRFSGQAFRAHWQKRRMSQEAYLARFSIGAEGLASLYRSLPHHPMPLAQAMGIVE
jgi:hypothetical protein